ncbi:MAG TPA: ABC transporter permease [Acidobacteriaceae bacterium]|nr:ABC transporter permease [Acidobacteriaceae bacterium]
MLRDLRLAIRQLLKSPGFTLTAIVMLTLGIGATTAIFSIVEGVLLRPLPFRQPQQLVVLSDILLGANFGNGNNEAGVTAPDIVAYSQYTRSFASLGGYGYDSYELSGVGEPAEVNAARMTASVFTVLGVQPLLGRVFTEQEDQQHQQVAVLSYAAWQKRFHGDPHILGTRILLDRKPYVVIGVMPRTFQFPFYDGHTNQAELWVPMSFTAEDLGVGAASWNYDMVGRLKPGITPAQAQGDAERVAQQIVKNYPAFMNSLRIRAVVRPLRQDTVSDARPLLHTLFLAVAVVLLIACFNLAGLLLLRAIRRRRELAVRLAIGARAAALLRQTMLESLVLSVTGGLLGLALAAATLRIGVKLLPNTLPRLDDISVDWRVALFALGVALLTGLLCGLAPGFAALHTDVNRALREGGRTGTAGGAHARLRSVLVIAEIGIALVLLCASGLLLRSFQKMRDVNLGFRPDHTLVASYDLPKEHYTTQAQVDAFNRQLLERVRQLPGVEDVGTATQLPVSGDNGNQAFVAEDYAKGAPLELCWSSKLLGNYFQAMDIPLLRGRQFNDADKPNTQLVAIVNKTLADHFWPGQDPIGQHVRWGMKETPTPWMTVVGEVGDVKQGSPDQPTKYQIYQPASQEMSSFGSLAAGVDDLNASGGTIVLRTALSPQLMENSLRSVVRSLDPQLPLTQMQTMEHALSDTEAPRRFNTLLISSFAGAALLLAILGIYSVIAFTVAQRAPEMAIRMALGSQRSEIRGIVFLSAAKLALAGCIIGLGGALAASELLRSFLFDVSPFDPLVLTLAAVAVLLLAVVASLLPAQRAASVDPTLALRSE